MLSNTDHSESISTDKKTTFSPSEFFAQWQEILKQLIYSTFGGSKNKAECMENFALGVEAAAVSHCDCKGVPSAERAETEKQLRYSSSLLLPIVLTVFFAGHEPSMGGNSNSFLEEDPQITLTASSSGKIDKMGRFCNSRLDSGDCFLRAGDCQGEVYLLPGAGVFKPEMPSMPTTRLRDGFDDSEHRREIAAFEVDRSYGGFARVPPTTFATVSADSLPDRDEDSEVLVPGSLQKWVHSVCSSEDMGSSRFKTSDIHHIGILDILLYNTDRHGGNILVSSTPTCGKARLVPIDHGLCLPEFRHLGQAEFEWLYWKQAQTPFTKRDLDLIASFNGDKVAGILRRLSLSSGSVLTARIMVALLQQTAIKRGWTLRKIGEFCTKHFTAKSSALQDVVSKTTAATGIKGGDVAFEGHAVFMDSFSKQLVQHLDKEIVV